MHAENVAITLFRLCKELLEIISTQSEVNSMVCLLMLGLDSNRVSDQFKNITVYL